MLVENARAVVGDQRATALYKRLKRDRLFIGQGVRLREDQDAVRVQRVDALLDIEVGHELVLKPNVLKPLRPRDPVQDRTRVRVVHRGQTIDPRRTVRFNVHHPRDADARLRVVDPDTVVLQRRPNEPFTHQRLHFAERRRERRQPGIWRVTVEPGLVVQCGPRDHAAIPMNEVVPQKPDVHL